MKITKENGELVLRLPLEQYSYDAVGELIGKTDSLIGVVAGQEFSISHLIDLGYEDDQQEGNPIIMFDTEQDLRKVCKEFGLDVWVHEICNTCKKVIRGTFTFNEKGNCCMECSES